MPKIQNLDDQAAAELAAGHAHIVRVQAQQQLERVRQHPFAKRWEAEGKLDELISRAEGDR
jgi:hypothetical protein